MNNIKRLIKEHFRMFPDHAFDETVLDMETSTIEPVNGFKKDVWMRLNAKAESSKGLLNFVLLLMCGYDNNTFIEVVLAEKSILIDDLSYENDDKVFEVAKELYNKFVASIEIPSHVYNAETDTGHTKNKTNMGITLSFMLYQNETRMRAEIFGVAYEKPELSDYYFCFRLGEKSFPPVEKKDFNPNAQIYRDWLQSFVDRGVFDISSQNGWEYSKYLFGI